MTGKYENNGKRIGIVITIVVLSVLLFATLCFSLFNANWAIVIEPTKQVEVNKIEDIVPPSAKCVGVVLCKNGFDVPVKLESHTQDGNVFTSVYKANWLWFSQTYEQPVKISELDTTAPTITLLPLDKTLLPDDEFVEPGYTASDDRDGDITNKVTVFESYDKVVYCVSDSAGNTAFAERDIIREDKESPKITLIDGESITICKNIPFKDPGCTAIDNCDGNLTDRVVCTGDVDVYITGSYELQYKVYDNSNNYTVVKRTIHVVDQLSDEGKGKTIYLTFDDGPSSYTKDLLQVLNKYKVKATFFVVGDSGRNSIFNNIVDDGHSIGIHTMTHEYKDIYKSEEAFLNDLYGMQKVIEEQTGVVTMLMRFPGGSSNTVSKSYCPGIMTALTKKVEELGFQYFDWNVSSGDAGGTTTKEGVVNNVISSVAKISGDSVVLQHDTKKFSVEAVEEIIVWGLEHGYTFAPLNMESPTAHHGVNN